LGGYTSISIPKFKLFTTARSPSELAEERDQVKNLLAFAEHLYNSNQEEAAIPQQIYKNSFRYRSVK